MLYYRSIVIILLFIFLPSGSIMAMGSANLADSIERVLLQTTEVKKQIELLLAATKQVKATNPDQALVFASRALFLSDSSDYPALRLQAMIDIGVIQAYKSQFKPAMEMALNAKELAIRLEDNKSLGDVELIIGMIKIIEGDYSESYEIHFSALRLFEESKDKEGELQALNGIGNTCYYQAKYDKAYQYYTEALLIARELKDTSQIGNVLNNVGLVLVEKGKLIEAIEYYNEAIEINKRLGLIIRLATNYFNLATASLRLDRYDDFLSYSDRAIEIYSSLGSRHNLATCYIEVSQYYYQIKDFETQLRYAMMAYSTGRQDNLQEVLYQSSNLLHEFYFKAGKIDSAYKYAMIWDAVKDSIFNEQSTAKFTLLEMEYNYDKNQKEEKLKQQQKDFTKILFIIIAISGLIITILLLSRQIIKTKNIRLEKKRLSDEIDFKNKELTLNVMNLIKKNELIVDISNDLVRMEQNVNDPSTKQEILRLINSLQKNSSKEIWEEFEVRFRQVHSSFYEKLLSRFPDLSSNELKLCALLRLNLSTKEICELSGQRPSSLDVARYRLRKKLGLASSQISLVTFLSQV